MKQKSNLLLSILIFIIIVIIIILIIYFHNKDKYVGNISDLSKLRICGTGNKVKSIIVNKLGAISNTPFLLDQHSYVTIKFLNKPSNKDGFKNTYRLGIFDDYDKNKNIKNYDPFELAMYDSKDVDIIENIKIIVRERFDPIINIKFIFLPFGYEGNSDVRISFDPNEGCFSYIGINYRTIPQDKCTMNFAWFDVGTVLHEFGHLLGLEHEHQSPFGNKINWNYPKLYKWGRKVQGWDKDEVDVQIVSPLNGPDIYGTSFDPESIMLYYYPAKLTTDGKGTKQNIRLSPKDVLYISRLYPPRPSDIYPGSRKKTPQEFYQEVYGENIDDIVL